MVPALNAHLDREARLDALLDKQDIMECLTRFSRGADRFDRDMYLSAFWPDAEMQQAPSWAARRIVGTGQSRCMSKARS